MAIAGKACEAPVKTPSWDGSPAVARRPRARCPCSATAARGREAWRLTERYRQISQGPVPRPSPAARRRPRARRPPRGALPASFVLACAHHQAGDLRDLCEPRRRGPATRAVSSARPRTYPWPSARCSAHGPNGARRAHAALLRTPRFIDPGSANAAAFPISSSARGLRGARCGLSHAAFCAVISTRPGGERGDALALKQQHGGTATEQDNSVDTTSGE